MREEIFTEFNFANYQFWCVSWNLISWGTKFAKLNSAKISSFIRYSIRSKFQLDEIFTIFSLFRQSHLEDSSVCALPLLLSNAILRHFVLWSRDTERISDSKKRRRAVRNFFFWFTRNIFYILLCASFLFLVDIIVVFFLIYGVFSLDGKKY